MKNKHKNQMDDVHNLIRGAIGSFKSTAFSKNKIKGFQNNDWRREQRALLQINKALDKAKAIVSPEEFQDLNKWVQTNLSGVLKGIDQLGCKLTSLGLFPVDINSKGLPVELSIIADRIELKFDSLSRFTNEFLVLESKFIHEQWQVIKDKINSLVEQHGYSYWAIEELIAAEEKLHGLEAMKTYVSTLNKSSTGANKFILYQIGVRNEPAQAAIRFKDSLRKRIDSSNIKTGLKPYFKFRLFGDMPSDEKSLAEVLAAEQLTTDIDLFFTSIKIALFIDCNKSFFSQRTLDANCNLLEKINPLISRMGMNTAGSDSQAKLLLTNEYDLKDIINKSVDISKLAVISVKALLCSDFKNKVLCEVPITTGKIISGILSQLSTISDGVDSDLTHQILLNHNCYPIVMQLGDFSHLKQLPRYLINIINQKNISNSYEVVHPLTEEISKLISEIVKSDLHSIADHRLELQTVIKSIQKSLKGNTSEAIEELNKYVTVDSDELWRDISRTVSSQLLYENGEVTKAISLSVDTYFKNNNLYALLPISNIFTGLKWKEIKNIDQSIEMCISLDLCLKELEDSKFKNYKRYSVQNLIEINGKNSITELFDYFLNIHKPKEYIEYFFDKVCDIQTIELLKGIESSEQSQQHRLDNLKKLVALGTGNKGLYDNEIKHIEHMLTINEGLQILDAGRVYVDRARLLNKLSKELSADFLRYQSLFRSGIGSNESFREILKSFKNPSLKLLQIPKSEADDLLFSILTVIQESFLCDSSHGLDIYLSRRIRHGEIAGLIRGPLEKESLIAQKPSAQESYKPPTYIKDLAIALEKKQRVKVFGVVSQFSESIDQAIASLRDDYFHIKSDEKPRGIFKVEINGVLFQCAKNFAQVAKTVDEFVFNVLELMWIFLEMGLSKDKPVFERETAKKLNTIFQKFISDMHLCNIQDEMLYTKIQRMSEEIRNKISVLSSWVTVPVVSTDKKYKLSKAIDLAIVRALAQHSSFRPNVRTHIKNPIEVNLSDHGLINDTLQIVFQNIYEHSEVLDNDVKINIVYNIDSNLLAFSILSQISPNVKVLEKEKNLKAIREKISKRDLVAARKDKNSGLMKIAAHLDDDGKGQIKFEFIENSYFLVEYSLPITGSIVDGPDEEFIEHNLDELSR